MNLISQRPKTWTDVAGQQRAIDVLQAMLRNQRFLNRGIILYGLLGVGKTTTAYLVARALMCTGDPDALGCGACASCKTADESGLDSHPDFQELDAASKSGVMDAREILDNSTHLPTIGKRRVFIIDEAQRLSTEAWDVYLKPLEQAADGIAVIIFVSNELEKIKATIRSRCIRIGFDRVPTKTIVGLLSSIATSNQINYELDALEIIARRSKGIVRDAVNWLNMAAALGTVKADILPDIIDTSLEDSCLKLLLLIAKQDQAEAVKLADMVSLKATPMRIVETLLSLYSRAVFAAETEELSAVYVGLSNVSAVTSVLLKWSVGLLPADVLPIIVLELLQTQTADPRNRVRKYATPAKAVAAAVPSYTPPPGQGPDFVAKVTPAPAPVDTSFLNASSNDFSDDEVI